MEIKRYTLINRFLIAILLLFAIVLFVYLYINISNLIELRKCESVMATYNSHYLMYTTLTDKVYLLSCNLKGLENDELVKIFYYIDQENKIITAKEIYKDANPILVTFLLFCFLSILLIRKRQIKEDNVLISKSTLITLSILDITYHSDIFGRYINLISKYKDNDIKIRIYGKQQKNIKINDKIKVYINESDLENYLIYEYEKVSQI